MEDIFVNGEGAKLLISLVKKDPWDKDTAVSLYVFKDGSAVLIKISLNRVLAALSALAEHAVVRGLLNDDRLLIEAVDNDRAALTVIAGGNRCLTGKFALSSLKEAISKLLPNQ